MSDFDAVLIKKTELERLRAEIERLKQLLRAALPAVRWDAGDDSLAHDIERALEGK
jgi:hypothetical protein